MKKEKQNLINRIQEYVMGAIDNNFVEEEMYDVKRGVYIAPAADEDDDWTEKGCVIIWKDADGNVTNSVPYQFDAYANSFADLVRNGIDIIDIIVNLVYYEIFGE